VPKAKPKPRPSGKPELFLIDGNSLAYRAFFALPEDMTTADGRPTNAIYGFASMLAKILTEHRPAAVVVAWDAGMSGREVAYEPYKAQRRPRPDLLREQWPHLAPLTEAFGFTNVKSEGFEADDVIGTLARQASEKGIPVMVVSGDRDVYQVVGDGIRVMTTSRGITDTKVYDREGVIERYGVPPELVPDLIGLKGDTSDNIPGVPGIGDKTASELLQRFGSLEAVLDSVDEISGPKRKQNLTEHADDARVSKQLATLQYDVACEIDLEEVMARPQDRSGLREVANRYELRQVIARLEDEFEETIPGRAVAEELEVEAEEGAIADLADGDVALAIAGERWAATDGERIVAGEATLADLVSEVRGRPLVAHDAKSLGGSGRDGLLSAAAVLAVEGTAASGEDLAQKAHGGGAATGEPGDPARASASELDLSFDTMVAAYLLDPARRAYELTELAADAGLAARPGAEAGGGEDAPGADAEQLSLEAEGQEQVRDPAAEARLAFELAQRQRPRLAEWGLESLLNEVEMPLIEVLAAMERIGIRVDAERLAEISSSLGDRVATLQKEIWELCGREFTIGSPQQLGEVLFTELGLTKKRRGKTGFSTDARVLAQIRDEHEVVPKIESWRELTKLKNTYLDALPELIDPQTGRIHTTFNQVATTTGRLSSTNPNLQNIPIRSEEGRPIRSCFVAAPGMKLLSCDYNQVELRVLAHVADEEVLREIFASGEDVHAATAAGIVGADPDAITPAERSKAKMVNYGIAYGLSDFGLADRLQIEREEAAAYIERYFERFPAVKRFIDATIERAKEEGYVTTLMGRRRRIPELRSSNRQRYLLGERLAVNTVIQGTAADIIKVAMVRSHRALAEAGLETRLVLQIHDELLFEGPEAEMAEAERIARAEMVGAFELDPPLAVDAGAGDDWLSAK
jgi:DNA polymerase-1